ncbi:MAG: FAD-binding protein [Paludibacteraceae bacterium]|nr:FAD-binding protein [Paludibacteraceae bacterium]
MHSQISIIVTPEQSSSKDLLKGEIAKKLGIKKSAIDKIQIVKKSIDARSRKQIKVNLTLNVYTDGTPMAPIHYPFAYHDVKDSPKVIIVGAGPAGLFAALRLIELGLKPIILERGKEVSERKKDIALLNRNNGLNIESNYCFGEGGAGTFSDGKLFTRSKKRGNGERILLNFHQHGAQDEILFEAHPHIGTDKLPTIIKNMRQTILKYGGEVHFNAKVAELLIENNEIHGVKTSEGDLFYASNVILATGHSARDIYHLLNNQEIALDAKGFAMGVRIEHPQSLIDKIQYHCKDRCGNNLPAASYNLVTQVNGRGVYSFCMCPGGFIVPASTYENECVVNGMSSSLRNSKFANSGFVVEIRPEDLRDYEKYGVLAGLKFQEEYEHLSFVNGGENAVAPAQRVKDFVDGIVSKDLPQTSYIPGVISSPMHSWIPPFIRERLQEGLKEFDKKMKGYLTNQAIIVGVESRTSSPIRIPRDPETLQHIEIKGLYPCGEGAGYAGGITSSAVDGELCAEKIFAKLNSEQNI